MRCVHVTCCTFFLSPLSRQLQPHYLHSMTSRDVSSLAFSLSFSALLAPGETRLIHTVALDEPLLLTIDLKYARTQASNPLYLPLLLSSNLFIYHLFSYPSTGHSCSPILISFLQLSCYSVCTYLLMYLFSYSHLFYYSTFLNPFFP